MLRSVIAVTVMLLVTAVHASDALYKVPPKEIVDIFDAAPPPVVVVNPLGSAMLLVDAEANPPISLLAEPMLRLAGLRIAPTLSARQRTFRSTGITVQSLIAGEARRVVLPLGARISTPVWSADGRRFAFTCDVTNGVELWVGDAATAVARPISKLRVTDVLGAAFSWQSNSRELLVQMVPSNRGPAPAAPRVPVGPTIDETAGKISPLPTFQDLLTSTADEALFEYYSRSQLAFVDVTSGSVRTVGQPDLYLSSEVSPDGRYVLVSRIKRPFSYRVPYSLFTRATEVWQINGTRVAVIAEHPVSDDVPRFGVPTGPRTVVWQPLKPASLIWVEALDGGDPAKKVPHRDRVMGVEAPFAHAPRELVKLRHRSSGFDWIAQSDIVLAHEFDRDRRWITTSLINLTTPETARIVFDRSLNDAYRDPGTPVYETRPSGERVVIQDGDSIYLAGDGASPGGNRPFLDKLDLVTLKTQRLFQSPDVSLERFVTFQRESRVSVVLRHESKTDPPNYSVLNVQTGQRRRLTDYKDPVPQLAQIRKELLKYQRPDGVPLTGTLYLPATYEAGTRLPALIWAYPLDYGDADTAGQVRATPNAFTRLTGPSPLYLVTQGYAVLMDATMPVVGNPDTMNDTYIEQISAAAKAAVDKLDALGVVDPKKVIIGGHSYGAFMTANLLAHTDLFVAGIARSGAYNRTLTPFGFQSERRSFWEAPDLYLRVSPFARADKIDEPVLLIHGQADNNVGTYPIQSERLFQALCGHGGTSRLIMLPHEAHGYRARESNLHVIAEMLEWADRWTGRLPATRTAR